MLERHPVFGIDYEDTDIMAPEWKSFRDRTNGRRLGSGEAEWLLSDINMRKIKDTTQFLNIRAGLVYVLPNENGEQQDVAPSPTEELKV